MKFKRGDKVRIINARLSQLAVDSIHTISSLLYNNIIVIVNNNKYWCFTTLDVELVEEYSENKYNIEAGDTINDITVSYVNSTGIVFNELNKKEYEHNWRLVISHIESGNWKFTSRVDKNKCTITGYKLLRDTPDFKAGYVFDTDSDGGINMSFKRAASYPANNPEWFEPIYKKVKPKEVFVCTLAGKVKVSNGLLSITGEYRAINIDDFQKASKLITDCVYNTTHSDIKVETFKVGCKVFHVDDIKPLQDAIKQVS